MTRMTITRDQVDILERDYRRNERSILAAVNARVSDGTARKYYARFKAMGITRGSEPKRSRDHWPAPYKGPEWIGNAIDG